MANPLAEQSSKPVPPTPWRSPPRRRPLAAELVAARELTFQRARVTRRDQTAFLGKLAIAVALLAGGVLLVLSGTGFRILLGILLLGAVYTHMGELQHQCLHHSAFLNAGRHRPVGVVLGLPVLVSYSHYRVRHLQHHRYVGTTQDSEFFGFDTGRPLTPRVMLAGLFDFQRLASVLGNCYRSWRGRWRDDQAQASERIRRDTAAEYRLMSLVFLAADGIALAGGWRLIVLLWWAPLLMVATPLHFLVELPEHVRCDTGTTDVLRNTRSISGSRFTTWFTNGNNLHVEHHAAMTVPINRLRERHPGVQLLGKYVERSYGSFYRQVLGEVAGRSRRRRRAARQGLMKGTLNMLNAQSAAPPAPPASAVVVEPGSGSYLPGWTLGEYRAHLRMTHPRLRALLDFQRAGAVDALAALTATNTEFDTDAGGRGDSYRRAQRDASVRWTGARRLLRLCCPVGPACGVTVLDVLGGDGTLARCLSRQDPDTAARLTVLTGDISGEMVGHALRYGLPAVRQAADFLFVRDGVLDATLLAYGTHHIAPEDRQAAVREALRVVRPHGRVVLHDFDGASPMAQFFGRVVHRYSVAGHDYRHFSREEIRDLFAATGARVTVLDVYDPLVVRAATEGGARQRMCDYVADMYGVATLFGGLGYAASWRLLEQCFDHTDYLTRVPGRYTGPSGPTVRRANGQFVAEVPRMAIVGVAKKEV